MTFKGTARFQVLDTLGQGGMGIVYDVYDRTRDMRVALKTLRSADATSLYRFKREFRSLSDISHPNIITLYELFSEHDEWFFTMELVEGQDFLSYVRGDRPAPSAMPTPLGEGDTRTATVLQPTYGASAPAPASGRVPDASGPMARGLPAIPVQRAEVAEVVDMDRLRDALRQLARALHALHAAGLVHRDLKPSNVRVTPKGRVVLMDFGMVAESRSPIDLGSAGAAIGTPAFMAPEQVIGAQPTAAADWYAFGVMLYVALTERLPYEGSILQVVDAKREIDPLPPGAFVDGIPADLERLCLELLHRQASRRPDDTAVLARLGATEAELLPGGKVIALDLGLGTFVGRDRERAALHQAYRAAAAGATRCAIVQGPSGMGKTSLIERFLDDLREPAGPPGEPAGPAPVVLAGRCHERESLPYKAFDGVMDSLAGRLVDMPEARRAAVLPADAALIARLFPVLRRIPGMDEGAPAAGGSPPLELRSRAIAALRATLAALARERPVVLHIEDIQWADRESFDLLLGLLHPPAPAGLMVVASLRAEDDAGTGPGSAQQAIELMRALEDREDCCRIVLGPLSEAEQRALVTVLAGARSALVAQADEQLWQDAAGSPMLLVELARYAQMAPEALAAAPDLRLEDLIWQRITRLPEPARVLMEAIGVAGEPLPLRVLADASGLSRIECERAASVLRISHLARTSRTDALPWLDAYHDKVREAVAGRVTAARARALHQGIAEALEAWGQAPVAMMARHRLAAGDHPRAAMYFIDAARSAADQLAFDRSAALYRTALDLIPEGAGNPHLDRLRCQAWIGLAEGMRIVDRTDEAMALLDRAVALATAQHMIQELATIHYLRGSLLFPRGDLDGCLSEHAKARAFARLARSPRREAQALSGLGDAYYMRGRMISAYQHFSMCIDLCRAHGLMDIEVANLAMRGMTRYYQNDLQAALRDSEAAANAAAEVGHHRAEIVARNGCVGWILVEMGQLAPARVELDRALAMARMLGARRFEPNSLTWLGKIAALEGRRAEAQALVEQSLAICRETGFAFVGPMALGALARVTPDAAVRARAVAEGEEILRGGSASHNYLYFYRDVMDALLAAGDVDGVERCAAALDHYTRLEPLPWSRFFAERGRALARYQRGARDPETRAALARLDAEARRVGLHLAARALGDALAAPAP